MTTPHASTSLFRRSSPAGERTTSCFEVRYADATAASETATSDSSVDIAAVLVQIASRCSSPIAYSTIAVRLPGAFA